MSLYLKLLIIENDDIKIDEIKNLLGDKFYSSDVEKDLQKGFEKVSDQYNVVISSIRLPNAKLDASELLKEFEKDETDKLDIPYIFFRTRGDVEECKKIERILSGKKFCFIDKDNLDYVYELEWAILNLVPKVFYNYRKDIKDSIKLYDQTQQNVKGIEKRISDINNNKIAIEKLNDENKSRMKEIENNRDEIEKLSLEQNEIKQKYVQWRNITESLGIMVGAFSLVVGIIVSLIILLLKWGEDTTVRLSWGLIAVIFLLLFLIWSYVMFLYFRFRSIKFIEKNVKKFFKDKSEEVIEHKVSQLIKRISR